MIPKIIHYCWFGRNPKNKSVEKCINSWRKFCPDYEIVEWNEDNFPVNDNLYCKQAYEISKIWRRVSGAAFEKHGFTLGQLPAKTKNSNVQYCSDRSSVIVY